MENYPTRIKRVLPFDINNNPSIKEINKNFKLITSSSDAYNQYMSKFYESPKHTDSDELNLKSKIFNEKKSDRSNTNSSSKNLSTKLNISIDNHSYMEAKYKMMSDMKSSYKILMSSKIKESFDTNINVSKKLKL